MRFKYTPALLMFVFVAAQSVSGATSDNTLDAPLYDRLGGIYPIAAVVDDFIERLLVNDTLNANPAIDASRHAIPRPGLKFLVTAFVAQAMGGPETYAGRTMKASHTHLNITEEQWDAKIVDFNATHDKFDVPDRERMELIDLLETTRSDIVTRSN